MNTLVYKGLICSVSQVTTKKKKQKELKKFSAPYVNSAPIPSLLDKQQKQSNFERLVEKIIEKYPSADRYSLTFRLL